MDVCVTGLCVQLACVRLACVCDWLVCVTGLCVQLTYACATGLCVGVVTDVCMLLGVCVHACMGREYGNLCQ